MARVARLAVVLAAASLTAGCFQPLYGSRPSVDAESVHDKLGGIDIPPIPAREGTTTTRLAVAMRNALQYDLNGNAGPSAPTHRLIVSARGDANHGDDRHRQRPADAPQVGVIKTVYQLIEIATGKVVLRDSARPCRLRHPGPEQRFATRAALREAALVAETIRNRLASYFIAGT